VVRGASVLGVGGLVERLGRAMLELACDPASEHRVAGERDPHAGVVTKPVLKLSFLHLMLESDA
jgi:hypothetical protein